MEMSEFSRLAFQKAEEFSLPLLQAQVDIAFCFDEIQFPQVVEAHLVRGTPLRLVVALVREMLGVRVTTTLAGSTASRSTLLEKGGGQGKKGTPDVLNTIISGFVCKMVAEWKAKG